jgi:hypothetical protein
MHKDVQMLVKALPFTVNVLKARALVLLRLISFRDVGLFYHDGKLIVNLPCHVFNRHHLIYLMVIHLSSLLCHSVVQLERIGLTTESNALTLNVAFVNKLLASNLVVLCVLLYEILHEAIPSELKELEEVVVRFKELRGKFIDLYCEDVRDLVNTLLVTSLHKFLLTQT